MPSVGKGYQGNISSADMPAVTTWAIDRAGMLLPGFGIGFWHCYSCGAPQAIGERKKHNSDPTSEHQTDDSRERAVVHKRRSQDGRYCDAPNYFDCQW